jgi:hypothetical protein
MIHSNDSSPVLPSTNAMTPEQISEATQENQDRNRPDQSQSVQNAHKSVANDSSTPGYGADDSQNEPRLNGSENQDDRVDDLGDNT